MKYYPASTTQQPIVLHVSSEWKREQDIIWYALREQAKRLNEITTMRQKKENKKND